MVSQMKALLDTNIIIPREVGKTKNYQIGKLYKWLDQLKYEKYVHYETINEINNHKDPDIKESFNIKFDSYHHIKHPLEFHLDVQKVSSIYDQNQNDLIDTKLLNEVYCGRVDILISDDKKIHTKANELGISDHVFKIEEFLEKTTSENPELVDYDVLAINKQQFGEIELTDSFFESFKEDYPPFEKWFVKHFDKSCYTCYDEDKLTAFLYVKLEDETEQYDDIEPKFYPKRRLKIGTLKVESNGFRIGERFLKIVFDNARIQKVDEIYVTIFDRTDDQIRLIDMLLEWGFSHHGVKHNDYGDELVLTRSFGKDKPVYIEEPRKSYPYFSWDTNKFIVKIQPEYHTELFPDSINTKEDKEEYKGNKPHRNRISKVYISHSRDRDLKPGDILIIYRIGESTPKRYSSTLTSICIVEDVRTTFKEFESFYDYCNRRTLFTKEELKDGWWNKYGDYKPFVIKFLYAFSFPTPKPTFDKLIDEGVFEDTSSLGPGFTKIDKEQFEKIAKIAFGKK